MPMDRPRVILPARSGPPDSVVFTTTQPGGPLFIGKYPGGSDFLCGPCRRTFLAVNILQDQLKDVYLKCSDCQGLSYFESSAPGHPIDFLHSIVVWPPGGNLATPKLMFSPVLSVVSVHVAGRYSWETGSRPPWRQVTTGNTLRPGYDPMTGLPGQYTPEVLPEVSNSPSSVLAVRRRIESILGDRIPPWDRLFPPRPGQELLLRDEHPLAREFLALEGAAQILETGGRIDTQGMVDALRDHEQLIRWKNHPFFFEQFSNVGDPTQYLHGILTLMVAGILIDRMQNGASLGRPEPESRRTPDLVLASGSRVRVRMEVKAPVALRYPPADPSNTWCHGVIRHAFRDAGVGAGGQLRPGLPGMLALVGIAIPETTLQRLEAQAIHDFSRGDGRRDHIAGVVIVSSVVMVNGEVWNGLPLTFTPETVLRPGLVTKLALNPRYSGEVTILPVQPQRVPPAPDAGAPGPVYSVEEGWPEIPSRLPEPFDR